MYKCTCIHTESGSQEVLTGNKKTTTVYAINLSRSIIASENLVVNVSTVSRMKMLIKSQCLITSSTTLNAYGLFEISGNFMTAESITKIKLLLYSTA